MERFFTNVGWSEWNLISEKFRQEFRPISDEVSLGLPGASAETDFDCGH